MPILALTLLLSSAFLHAFWNLLLKQSHEKYIAMGWQVIIGSVVSIIALFFTGLPSHELWPYVFISTILEAIYFGLLVSAYNDSDFSLVYPIARGTAPALVVIWSALLLGERPTVGGLMGILLIVLGLVIMGATTLQRNQAGKLHIRGVAGALSVALVISIYTIVDGFAVKHGPALPYGLGLFMLMPIFTTPFVLRYTGAKSFVKAFQAQPWRYIIVGILAAIAYLSALFAYSIAPVNYSEAIREVSVVLGAFAGWYFLKEQMGRVRVLGACMIFVGIVLIASLG